MDMEHPERYVRPVVSAGSMKRGAHRGYICDWSVLVGQRIRRVRRERDMSLKELGLQMAKPGGGSYSPSHVSRVERGWSSSPLYAYLVIAAVLDLEPGKLLGPDACAYDVSEEEAVLLRCVKSLGLEPHEAILRITSER